MSRMDFSEAFKELFGKPDASPTDAAKNYMKAVGVSQGFRFAQQTFAKWADEAGQPQLAARIRNAKLEYK